MTCNLSKPYLFADDGALLCKDISVRKPIFNLNIKLK